MFPETRPWDIHSKGKGNRSTQVHYRTLPAELQRRASLRPQHGNHFAEYNNGLLLATAAACALRTRCPNFERKSSRLGPPASINLLIAGWTSRTINRSLFLLDLRPPPARSTASLARYDVISSLRRQQIRLCPKNPKQCGNAVQQNSIIPIELHNMSCTKRGGN
jgi:hypothetical protein